MIRLVFDTNVIISGSLWSGAPNRALRTAREGRVKAFIEAMLDELVEVIARPKFSNRLALLKMTPDAVVNTFIQFAEVIEAQPIVPTVYADHDDAVLACAFTAQAVCVVSGDPHLLKLGKIQEVAILSVRTFLQQVVADLLE